MEKPEYFIVAPSVKLFGGVKVTKEMNFETWNDDKSVHQVLKDLVLTTEINREIDGQYKSTEQSKMTTTLPEGTILIWSEETGYIVPNYHMVKVEEAIEMLNKVKDITEPIENK